jgi:hypothetical protein
LPIHQFADPEAREVKCREHRSAPELLVIAARLSLELGGGVEQRHKFIHLEKRALRPHSLEKPRRAAADANRVALNHS